VAGLVFQAGLVGQVLAVIVAGLALAASAVLLATPVFQVGQAGLVYPVGLA